MKINKTMLAAGIITTVAAGSLIGTSVVSAHGGENGSNVIDKLVERFSLNREEVEQVFEEIHDERRAEMEAKQTERLANLVEDGTITQEQANAVLEKYEELEAKREELKDQDLTHEEMHEQMKAEHEEFEAWAEEQGIDLDEIRPGKGKGFGGRMHGKAHFEGGMERTTE